MVSKFFRLCVHGFAFTVVYLYIFYVCGHINTFVLLFRLSSDVSFMYLFWTQIPLVTVNIAPNLSQRYYIFRDGIYFQYLKIVQFQILWLSFSCFLNFRYIFIFHPTAGAPTTSNSSAASPPQIHPPHQLEYIRPMTPLPHHPIHPPHRQVFLIFFDFAFSSLICDSYLRTFFLRWWVDEFEVVGRMNLARWGGVASEFEVVGRMNLRRWALWRWDEK